MHLSIPPSLVRPVALSAAFLLGSISSASALWEADWTWGHPAPQGNAIYNFAFANASSGWAVGGGGLVLRTVDGGESWASLHGPAGFAGDLNDIVALSTEDLVAVGTDDRIYRSTDAGLSWENIDNPATGGLRDITTYPGGISAAGENGHVVLSTDGGWNWVEVGPGEGTIRHHVWQSGTEAYVVGEDVSHRTTDGGETWVRITDDTPFGFNEVYFADANRGYIIEDFGTWESTDGGVTWTEHFAPVPPLYRFRTEVLGPDHWLTVTLLEGAELWETTDGGETWENRIDRRVVGFPTIHRTPSGRILVGSDAGDLFWSDDNGVTLHNATANLCDHSAPAAAFTNLIRRPDGVVFAANQPTAGKDPCWLRSDDQGLSWFTPDNVPGLYWIDAQGFADADHGLLTYRNDVRTTTDGGDTWQSHSLETDRRTWDAALPAVDRYFLTSTLDATGDLLRSTDGGATWAPVGGGVPTGTFIAATVDFVSPMIGIASGAIGSAPRLFQTTDGGDSWNLIVPTGLPRAPSAMHWFDADAGLAGVFSGTTPGIYRTTNGGAQWTMVSSERALAFSFLDNFEGCAVGYYDDTFQRTTDGGVTWTDEFPRFHGPAPGIQLGRVNSVCAVDDAWIFGGSNSRLIRARSLTPTSTDLDATEPKSRAGGVWIENAFPNPSAGETSLRLRLEADAQTRLTVHDATGRRVRLLHAEPLAAGLHPMTWDGRNDRGEKLPAGIYHIRVTSELGWAATKVVIQR